MSTNWQSSWVSSFLMKYLGLPFGAHFKASQIWDSIIDSIGIGDWLSARKCTYQKGGDSL